MSANPELVLSVEPPAQYAAEQQAMLEQFFASNESTVGLNFGETAGFLFAVLSCPERIAPSMWLEPVLADVSFKDQAEASRVLGALQALQNWMGARLDAHQSPVPPGYEPATDPQANFQPGFPFTHWVKGFSSGHGWLREIWDRHVPDDADEGAGLALMVLTFFGSMKVARNYHQEMYPEMSFDELVDICHKMLPEAFFGYSDVGRSAFMDSLQTSGQTQKVGRNDPCPCGSGEKHKKCCGRPH